MSITVTREVDPPGSDAYLEPAWDLKERIRADEGVLKQRRRFFAHAYRRANVYLYLAGEDVVGFAAARSDGYMLFLAVAPEHRGDGLGRALVAAVAEDVDRVTCHARVTNEGALAFYRRLGFEDVRRIEGYYEDGGDAAYLRLGESQRWLDKLAGLFH